MTVQHRSGNTIAADDLRLLQTLLETTPLSRSPRSSTIFLRTLDEQENQVLLRTLLETALPRRDDSLHPVILHTLGEQHSQISGNHLRSTKLDSLLYYSQRILAVTSVLVLGYWFVDGPVHDWAHSRQLALRPSMSRATSITADVRSLPLQTDFTLPYSSTKTYQEDLDFVAPRQRTITARVDRIEAPPLQNEDFAAPRHIVMPARIARVAAQPVHLLIPSIAVDTPVVETFVVDGEWQVADYAAGYLHDTGLPGDPGNMVIGGHLGLRGGVFRDLAKLTPGADVYVDAAGWRYQYRVREAKTVWPTQTEVLYPTETPTLTLLTCTNWDTQLLVVVADIIAAKPLPPT